MPRFLPTLALALALTLLCAVPASAKRTVPKAFFSVVFDGHSSVASVEDQDEEFGLMATSGVESARVTFPWTALEPNRKKFDFDRTDKTVAAAAKHRIEVLPAILYTPYWARAYKKKPYSPPKRVADFNLLLRKVIARYGSSGSFWKQYPDLPKMPVRYWQIWNEPNNDIERYWDAPRNSKYGWPHGYVSLLRSAHKTIHGADPRARTVLAGITGIAWLEMRRLYKAGGRNAFDVAALQVYPETVSREVEALNRFRQELVRARDRDVRVWVTEVAFPAAKGKTKPIHKQKQQTAQGMAAHLSELYARLGRRRQRWGLDRVYWYTWASRYGKSKSAFDFSGLFASKDDAKRKPQPAYTAYRRAAQRAEGCVKTVFGICER